MPANEYGRSGRWARTPQWVFKLVMKDDEEHSQSIPQRLHIITEGTHCSAEASQMLPVPVVNVCILSVRQCRLIEWMGRNSCVFLLKIHSLILLLRKPQTQIERQSTKYLM
jgi:hypothetical protein